MTDECSGDTERSIKDIAHDYLQAVGDHEAKEEELLARWAEEYYRPGYLDDGEWERLKFLMDADDTDHALMQIEIACFRKAATELGREGEFDDDWPAKSSTGSDRSDGGKP
jgi:hypothetical protein